MKKNVFILASLAAILSGCATTDGLGASSTQNASTYGSAAEQIGMTAVKVAVNAKCTTELNQLDAWKTISKTLSAEQQQTVQGNICGCVSEKAPSSVTAVDLATAAIDPAARTSIASNAISRTLNQCVTEALK
ncbi:hypothetical protein [Acinetobacter sp. MD2(2019)]|uniref:hypothetical protein n=1 Tax=Acinetobacter sp. MD2(2019) TaxID=2605273 RepID=UPI002D1E9824|nr:hypothetical protein [Acinetobacter sp. MD2(2019)]MEB3752901.1 hypothetical protein [Acinetobacter sp. MD2(2019)]